MEFFNEPRVTLLARPAFREPDHLPVSWLGESTDGERLSEFAGRLCYMSQANPAKRPTREYIDNIKKQGHGSVLEHANYSLLLEGVSRSLTHELVRHRAGFAYSQLSQRYVDESNAAFVVPPAIIGDEALEKAWRDQVVGAQKTYVSLVEQLMERYGWVADRAHRRGRRAGDPPPRGRRAAAAATRGARVLRGLRDLRCGRSSRGRARRIPQGLSRR